MDDPRFDRFVIHLSERLNRRRLGVMAAGVLSSRGAGTLTVQESGAKKKKKRKKKRSATSPAPPPNSPPPPKSPPASPPASPLSPPPPPPPPPGTVIAIYDGALQGEVDGLTFQRSAVLSLVQPFSSSGTQNGSNFVDVCLASGDPRNAPSTGSILLGSNSACFRGGAGLDLAVVSRPTTAQIRVEPDPNLAATCNNIYNRTSGLAAFVYAPYTGGMLLELREEGRVIVGVIDTSGLGSCRTPVGSRYQAVFAGQLR